MFAALGAGCDRAPQTPPKTIAAADVSAAISAAEKALDDGRIDDAVHLAQFAAKARDSAATHELLGRCLLAQASREESRGRDAHATRRASADAYRRAARLDPNGAALQHATAMVLDAAGDADGAAPYYDRAVELAPRSVEFLVHRANSRIRANDLAAAGRDLAQLRGLAPEEPWTHAVGAELKLAGGDAEGAVADASRAVELAPSAIEFRILRARALRSADRAKDAVEMLAALPATERTQPAVVAELAAAWVALAQFDKAAEAWERAHAAHPETLALAVEAARAKLRAGDRLGARRMIDDARRIAPDHADVAALERELSAASVPRPAESSRP